MHGASQRTTFVVALFLFGLVSVGFGALEAFAKSGSCDGVGRRYQGGTFAHFCSGPCPVDHDCMLRNVGPVTANGTTYPTWHTCCCVPFTMFTPPGGGDPQKVYGTPVYDSAAGLPSCDVSSTWSEAGICTSVGCAGGCPGATPFCRESSVPPTGDFKCACSAQ